MEYTIVIMKMKLIIMPDSGDEIYKGVCNYAYIKYMCFIFPLVLPLSVSNVLLRPRIFRIDGLEDLDIILPIDVYEPLNTCCHSTLSNKHSVINTNHGPHKLSEWKEQAQTNRLLSHLCPAELYFIFSGYAAIHNDAPQSEGLLLDKWSAHHRDLYLTIHNTHNRQTYMPPVGFEPTTVVGKLP
jgi:hypothetical protein